MSPKKTEASRPKPGYLRAPSVLVLKEKHGDRHFNVADDAALHRVALKILTERFEQGYWYYKPEDKDKPEAPDFTMEQVATLPESLRAKADKKLREYTDACRRYDAEVEDYNDIETAVKNKDGKLAWEALQAHRDGEYEGFNIERLESV